LCELVLEAVVDAVYWCAPVATGPFESAVATSRNPGEDAPLKLVSARSVKDGVKPLTLIDWFAVNVVRKLKKPIAQALADGFDTDGPTTVVLLERSNAAPEAAIGLDAATPRQAPVWKITLVLFVHVTDGADSPLPAIL